MPFQLTQVNLLPIEKNNGDYMANQINIIHNELTKQLISELCLASFNNYGEKQVTITLYSSIPTINVMVGNSYKIDSFSNYALDAADTDINLKSAIVYLRSLQVSNNDKEKVSVKK